MTAGPPDGDREAMDRRVATALTALGWRSASDEPAEAVAPTISLLLAAFARHCDRARLRRGIAEHLRQHAHALDGGGAAAAAWEPMAMELMTRCGVG